MDGDLVFVPVVDGLDIECVEEPFGQIGGGAGEDVAQERQLVEQAGVAGLLGGAFFEGG